MRIVYPHRLELSRQQHTRRLAQDHTSPDSHFANFRISLSSFVRYVFLPFFLLLIPFFYLAINSGRHPLYSVARSVPVYSPLCLAPARYVNQVPLRPLFPFAYPASSLSLRPLLIRQPCRWSHKCLSRSAIATSSLGLVQAACAEPSRVHTHTHTHVPSPFLLPLAPSLSPRDPVFGPPPNSH